MKENVDGADMHRYICGMNSVQIVLGIVAIVLVAFAAGHFIP